MKYWMDSPLRDVVLVCVRTNFLQNCILGVVNIKFLARSFCAYVAKIQPDLIINLIFPRWVLAMICVFLLCLLCRRHRDLGYLKGLFKLGNNIFSLLSGRPGVTEFSGVCIKVQGLDVITMVEKERTYIYYI
jgi:hypothetical protein